MKKIILVLFFPLGVLAQGGINIESCIKFHKENIKSVPSLSEAYRKSFYAGEYDCFEGALKQPQYANDTVVYNAFIAACFYGKAWRFGKGAEAYLKAVENKVELDSTTKALALYCWVNSIGTIVLPSGTNVIGEKLSNKLDIYFKLFDEMIAKDRSFVCLRMTVYNKMQNCYEHRNDEMFTKYHNLFVEDKKECDGCCTINKNSSFEITNVVKQR